MESQPITLDQCLPKLMDLLLDDRLLETETRQKANPGL